MLYQSSESSLKYYAKQNQQLDKLKYCIEEKTQVCYSKCIHIVIRFYRIETARALFEIHHRPRVTDAITGCNFFIGTRLAIILVNGLVLNAVGQPGSVGFDDKVGIEAGPKLSMPRIEAMLARRVHRLVLDVPVRTLVHRLHLNDQSILTHSLGVLADKAAHDSFDVVKATVPFGFIIELGLLELVHFVRGFHLLNGSKSRYKTRMY